MKPLLDISLFGKCSIVCNGNKLTRALGAKEIELLSILCLHRDRPMNREVLASLLWGDQCTTAQARTYLRKTLCRLQKQISRIDACICRQLLLADTHWIQLNSCPVLSLDILKLESFYQPLEPLSVAEMDEDRMDELDRAIDLYTGDLLIGWYQDWCIVFRERFQMMYLTLLDKAMAYCEANLRYRAGLFYGNRILQYDAGRERTHRLMMKLHYLTGDRTSALRQYERCVNILHEDWDLEPADSTRQLANLIRAGKDIEPYALLALPALPLPPGKQPSLHTLLIELKRGIEYLHTHVQHAILAFEDPASSPPATDKDG